VYKSADILPGPTLTNITFADSGILRQISVSTYEVEDQREFTIYSPLTKAFIILSRVEGIRTVNCNLFLIRKTPTTFYEVFMVSLTE